MGATFIALGTDSNLMVKATSGLAAKFKGAAQPQQAAKPQNY
jgi:4-hydroxy-2-oxoheptanedioate aldolase